MACSSFNLTMLSGSMDSELQQSASPRLQIFFWKVDPWACL